MHVTTVLERSVGAACATVLLNWSASATRLATDLVKDTLALNVLRRNTGLEKRRARLATSLCQQLNFRRTRKNVLIVMEKNAAAQSAMKSKNFLTSIALLEGMVFGEYALLVCAIFAKTTGGLARESAMRVDSSKLTSRSTSLSALIATKAARGAVDAMKSCRLIASTMTRLIRLAIKHIAETALRSEMHTDVPILSRDVDRVIGTLKDPSL